MPVQKTTTVISNNITLTAGGGPTTTSSIATLLGWHKMIHLKITNGATGPSTPASVLIEASPDNTNFYTLQTGLTGGTGNSEISSTTILTFAAIQYLRLVWTHPTGQNVTARGEISEALEIANSVTSTTDTVIGTADAANDAERVNVYNEYGTSFAHTQTTIGITAVQLGTNTATKGVSVKASNLNTYTIYVGNSSGVTIATGVELGPGESIFVPIDNSNKIYCISNGASQSISYLVI